MQNAERLGHTDLSDSLPAPVMAIDREMSVVRMNAAGARLLGLTPEACVGRKCYDLFKTKHCRTSDCRCAQAMEAGSASTGETEASVGGQVLPIRYTGAPLRDDDGHVIGAVEYVLDISAEVAERGRVAQLVDSLNGIPTPIVSIDRDYNVIAMNPAGAGVLQMTVEQCIGRKCYDLFKTPHCQTRQCACRQAMEKDGAFTEETVADPNGLNLPIRYTGAPLRNAAGAIVGAVEFVLDMSDEVEKRAHNREVTDVVFKLKQNDLTGRISGTYDGELGEVKNAMNGGLTAINDVMLDVVQSVNQVAETARQTSIASQKLAEGAQEQASAVEEISASIEETDEQIKANAENAAIANQLVTTTNDTAMAGRAEMERMLTAMSEIHESSQSISKIMKVIDEIAFQTNILALNAAVEAARAGRHGRGFAVVAQEVRSLAGRSAKAAQETAELIEASNKKVTNGGDIARKTAKSLDEIVNNVTKVKDLVAEIAAASSEQAAGVAQIAAGINQISSGVSAVTAQSEETAAASEQLTGVATNLKDQVSVFDLLQKAPATPLGLELPPGFTPELLMQLATMLRAQAPAAASPAAQTRSAEPKLAPRTPASALPLDTDPRGYGSF